MRILVRFLSYTRSHWRLLSVIVLLGLLTAAINVGQARLIAGCLASIFAGSNWNDVAGLLIAVALLLGVRAIAAGLGEHLGILIATRVKGALRQCLYLKLFELGPGWLGHERIGKLQTVLVDSLEMIQVYFSHLIPKALISIFSVIAIPGYVILIDPTVGLIVMGSAFLAIVLPGVSSHLLRRETRFWWDRYYPLNAEYLDSIQGMVTLKGFNASRTRGRELKKDAFAVRDAAIRLIKLVVVYQGLMSLVIAVGTTASMGLGALHVAHETLAAPDLLLILLLIGQCFAPVRDMKAAFHYAYYIPTVGASIYEVLDAEPPVAESAIPRAQQPLTSSLSFNNVTFRYRADSRPALRDISFAVRSGETVAIVGRSGAGKTTMVGLLLRFLDPQKGKILLGGVDLQELALADLRAQIALVSQDVYLFHGTIRENLLFARPDATGEDLIRAAKTAAAHEFISALPAGYETIVGERGLKLSGGERQRIAIARALLKDAPILVLDEATSSIDIANEAVIQEALKTVTVGRTTVIIAHRISTVRDADRILVLDDGRLIEEGDHEGLIATGGIYAGLVSLQGAHR